MIERHPLPVLGGYWKSYDFDPLRKAQPGGDLFAAPLGPVGAGLSRDPKLEFKHDGGEIIWTLPNGLQAYLLVDAKGKRLGQAPSNIVRDSSRADGTIINGVSCMSCHTNGMFPPPEDEITKVAGAAFGVTETANVRRLYNQDAIVAAVADDTARFQRAVVACGVDPSAKEEPVRALYDRFLSAVSVDSLGSELGLQKDALDRLKNSKNAEVRLIETKFKAGVIIPRLLFISQFKAVATALNLVLKTSQAPPFEEFGGEKNLALAMQESGIQIEPSEAGEPGDIDKAKALAREIAQKSRAQGYRIVPLGSGDSKNDLFADIDLTKGTDCRLIVGTDQINHPVQLLVKTDTGTLIAQGDSSGLFEIRATYNGTYTIIVRPSPDDPRGVFAMLAAFRPTDFASGASVSQIQEAIRNNKLEDATAVKTAIPPNAKKPTVPSWLPVEADRMTTDQAANLFANLKQQGYSGSSLLDESERLVYDGKILLRVELIKGKETQLIVGVDEVAGNVTVEIDDADGQPVANLGPAFNYDTKEIVVLTTGITRRLYTLKQGVIQFTPPYNGEYRIRLNLPEERLGVKVFMGAAIRSNK
jgi:hypothetical protein